MWFFYLFPEDGSFIIHKAYFIRDSCHTQVKDKEISCVFLNSLLFISYSICHSVFGVTCLEFFFHYAVVTNYHFNDCAFYVASYILLYTQ